MYNVAQVSTLSIFQKLSIYLITDDAFKKSIVTISKIDLVIGIEYYDRIMMTESVNVGYAKLKETHFG